VPTNRSAIAFAWGAPNRRTDYVHALGLKHLVERAAELGVAVMDEEAEALPALSQRHREVSRLLSAPGRGWVRRHAAEMDSPALKLDEEQNV
jgi:hypothetical protein